MAGSCRDRTGGGFCVSALLRLESRDSPGPGTRTSWPLSGEANQGTQVEKFDKFRGFPLKMDPTLQSPVVHTVVYIAKGLLASEGRIGFLLLVLES